VRKAALSSLAVAVVAYGVVAVSAAGGDGPDVHGANLRTAQQPSVHYVVDVVLRKDLRPMTLRIAGGSSRDAVAVRLSLGSLTLSDGTVLPGTTAKLRMSKPFLYEGAPNGTPVFGQIRWLRLHVLDLPENSQTLSTMRALTPSPLLRVISATKLRAGGKAGWFTGPVAYDDPIVRTALHALAAGLEFRHMRVSVKVGADELVHAVWLTGRTADATTTFTVRAKLFGFGKPVKVVPPKPGTFMDPQLLALES
jgi:hypothetical protein